MSQVKLKAYVFDLGHVRNENKLILTQTMLSFPKPYHVARCLNQSATISHVTKTTTAR